jgi:voltage-gated potassium channel
MSQSLKMKQIEKEIPESDWRRKLHEIVFEADTTPGKTFDVVIICLILLSIIVVALDSVKSIREQFGTPLLYLEWSLTVLFSIEYLLRLIAVKRPVRYILSFYGLIDLCAILPTYISLFVPGTQYLLTIRILRLLRIFRILKLSEYIAEANVITDALWASRKKISVFFTAIIAMVTIMGSMMYVIEGEEHGFTDIPTSIYWAVVTLTTVGYGDLSPKTALGKTFASLVMIMGYAILAVPTGIVTAELTRSAKRYSTQVCPECHAQDHELEAIHCKYCGAKL